MISPAQVYLAIEPVDMRWGIKRLSCHVQHAIGRSPCEGSAYAFTNRQRSRLKLLIRDATGVWLCQRRLHLPLYRLEQIAARQNVTLARSTLSEWIGRIGFALQPLAGWHNTCGKGIACMPTKPPSNNSTPAKTKRNAPTCGPTAATTWTTVHPSSSSTTWLKSMLESLPSCLNAQIDTLLPSNNPPAEPGAFMVRAAQSG